MIAFRKIIRFLQKQGYRVVRQEGSHMTLEHPSRRTLVVPFRRGDLPKGLTLRILKDAGFTLEDFRRS